MKLAVILVLIVAATLANGASLEKRGLRDTVRGVVHNVTESGKDVLSDLFDFASRRWRNLRDRLRDYNIRGHLSNLRERAKARYGDLIDTVSDLRIEHIAKAARNVIENAADVLQVDSIVDRVRGLLGREVEDLPDEEIADIVKAVEDDAGDEDEEGTVLQKRGLRDTLRGVFYNVTESGRDALSDLFDLASRGWNNLRQRLREYSLPSHFAAIREGVKSRYGSFIDQISELRFEHIAEAARDVIEDAADVLQVDRIVERIRALLGREVEDLPDEEIADIVKVLEDDAASE